MARSTIVLDPNKCIFNSVGSFVEQVGRRSVQRFNELDTMTCIWNGPVSDAWNFLPKKGSKHPLYPLMIVTDAEIINQAALMADVQVTYTGIIDSSIDMTESNGIWMTKPILSWQPVQGSRDYQEFWVLQRVNTITTTGTSSGTVIDGVPQPVSQQKSYFTYDYGTRSRAIRYVGQNVSVHYFAYPNPPTSVQFAQQYAGKATWKILSSIVGPYNVIATNAPSYPRDVQVFGGLPPLSYIIGQVPPLYSAQLGFDVKPRGVWYEITETYGPTF